MANPRLFTIESGFADVEVRVVREELERAGWKQTDGDEWGLRWESRVLTAEEATPLVRGDWINYLPGVMAYAMKNRLHDNVMGARVWSGDTTPGIHAHAYTMPDDRAAWLAERDRSPEKLWIKKPKGSAKGRGIELVESVDEVPNDPDWMVQEYLDRPHLLDGFKYVLRRYLLITSLHPFVCYLHEAGVYKRTSRPYTLDPGSLKDRLVHLTNPPVQKANTDVSWGSGNSDLVAYRSALRAEGIDDEALFERMDEAIAKVAIACREDAFLLAQHVDGEKHGCFDTLGIDVMIDADLNPWILECNVGPKMSVSDEYDATAAEMVRAAKDASIRDSLSLLGLTRDPMPAGDQASYWKRRLDYEADGAGGYSRLWPREDGEHLRSWFPILRPADRGLLASVTGVAEPDEPDFDAKPDVSAHALSSGLALFSESQQRFYWLNDTGALVWLCLADGISPAGATDVWVAAEKEAGRSLGFDEAHQDVWNLITAWGQRGLLVGTRGPEAHGPGHDHVGPSSIEIRESTAFIDLRPASEEGGGSRSAGRELPAQSLVGSVQQLVFLVEGTRVHLQVCNTTDLLDHLLRAFGRRSPLDRSEAGELVRWADQVQAFELVGSPGFDETSRTTLLDLVSPKSNV